MNARPIDTALDYASRRGWPVFPCHWRGELRKRPLTKHGLHDASTDPQVIKAWWHRGPDALIGIPTGSAIGAIVLDIDVKDDRANGFDSLKRLGLKHLPDTPMVHTASGGLHVYFALPDKVEIRNTAGERGRGIGLGLDWRGDGGYVIAPSPGSGYEWDPIWNFLTVHPAAVPLALLPREAERAVHSKPIRPTVGLSPYAEAALDSACRKIIAAPAGEQETTLHIECFSIGTLAGAGGVPINFAQDVLVWAAEQIPDYDSSRPWRAGELEQKVRRAFDRGMRRPRGIDHG